MNKIRKIIKLDIDHCIKLINSEEDFIQFKTMGWSEKQLITQINKSINYSIGLYENNEMIAFMFGDLICVEKISEYEILLIYVKKSKRCNGIASNLIDYILKIKDNLKLTKIFLDVAESNIIAINLYKKYKFELIDKREKYYLIDGKFIDALCFAKAI